MKKLLVVLIFVASFALAQAPATSQWKRTGPTTIAPRRAGDSVAIGTTVLDAARGITAPNRPGLVTSGLIAEWRFNEGTGTALTDYSGNGNNCTLIATPTWVTGGLSLNGTSQFASCATITQSQIQTVQVFADTWTNGILATPAGAYQALVASSTGNGFKVLSATTDYGAGTQVGVMLNYAYPSLSYDEVAGPMLVSAVLGNNANDTLYVNGVAVTAYKARTGTGSYLPAKTGTFEIGASDGASIYSKGTFYYAVLYNRSLTAVEVAQNYAYMRDVISTRGVTLTPANTSTTSQLLLVGDSRTQGASAQTPYPTSISTLDTFVVRNLGLSGATSANMRAMVPAFCGYYAPNARRNVALVWGVVNDSGTAAARADSTAATAKALKQCGFRVIVGTEISANSSFDTTKNAYNTIIKNTWQNYADALADFSSNANLGADSAYSNSTYFVDGIHPTTAGNALLAAIASSAINYSLGAAAVPFASLPVAANGTTVYCSDCNTTCTAGSSTGRTCFRENGAWTH